MLSHYVFSLCLYGTAAYTFTQQVKNRYIYYIFNNLLFQISLFYQLFLNLSTVPLLQVMAAADFSRTRGPAGARGLFLILSLLCLISVSTSLYPEDQLVNSFLLNSLLWYNNYTFLCTCTVTSSLTAVIFFLYLQWTIDAGVHEDSDKRSRQSEGELLRLQVSFFKSAVYFLNECILHWTVYSDMLKV